MSTNPLSYEWLRASIADLLEIPASDVGDDDNLMDLGLDSMRAMNLVVKWEEAGVPLDFTDLAEAMTLAGLWAALGARLKGD
jgi:aryl carrier-like protein